MQPLKLTPQEETFYQQAWNYALSKNPNQHSEEIVSQVAAQILSLSGLPKDNLRTIWKMSTQQATFMSKSEFFMALKLIALKQNFIQMTTENVKLFTVLPKLEGIELK